MKSEAGVRSFCGESDAGEQMAAAQQSGAEGLEEPLLLLLL